MVSIWLGRILLIFISISQAAQQLAHDVAEGGPGQGSKWHGPNNIERGKTESRRHKAIEHTLAQTRRQLGGDAMAQHLLNKTVAAG